MLASFEKEQWVENAAAMAHLVLDALPDPATADGPDQARR